MKNKERIVEFESGIFKNLCLKFLKYKRGLGLEYKDSVEYTLRVLNKNLNKLHIKSPNLSKKNIEHLAAKKDNESVSTHVKRITLLRQFSLFINYMGFKAYIYPVNYMPRYINSFVPYIFTKDQILAVFKEADALQPCVQYPKFHIIYPTLIRVLYGCGLRLSEVLSLKKNNVDLINGLILIEKAKKDKSRLIPISASLTANCIEYEKKMNCKFDSDDFFFPARDQGKYSKSAVRHQIIKLYAKAGIPILKNGLFPRVHDLRHSWAVHTMENMIKKGYDLYYSLPVLSTYLGHKGIRETEKYLRLTENKFNDILNYQKKSGIRVIPEVVSNEKN